MNPDSFDSDNLLLGIKLRTFLLKFALCNFSFSILFSEKILQCHIFLFSNWKGFKLKNYYICFTHLLFFKKEIWLGTKYMWKTFLSPEIHLKNRTETQLTMNRRKKKRFSWFLQMQLLQITIALQKVFVESVSIFKQNREVPVQS